MTFGGRQPVRRELVSTQWKKVTPHVKARDHFRCQVCGVEERYRVTARGRRMSNLVVGHKIPPERYQGSHHDPANLWTLCRACNASQMNRTPEEWRAAATGRLVRLGLSQPTPRRSSVVSVDYTRRRTDP